MYNITEQFLQESGFQYDERDEQYRKDCCKYLFVCVKPEPEGFCDVIVEIYETRGWVNHITSQQQLKDLVKVISGEEI